MDKYAYLLLGLSLAAVLAVLLLVRKDLAPKAVKMGLFGGLIGLLAQAFYIRDYWQPPTLLGVNKLSLEDFIFGFVIIALSVTIYPALFGYVFGERKYPRRRRLFGLFFAGVFLSLFVFSVCMGVNSIAVSYAVFAIFGTVMLIMRRDLLRPALYTTIVLTTLMIVIYAVLFGIIAPDFWHNYWLLANTKWGATILGGVPLTEVAWYVCCGLFAGASYPFISGRELIKRY